MYVKPLAYTTVLYPLYFCVSFLEYVYDAPKPDCRPFKGTTCDIERFEITRIIQLQLNISIPESRNTTYPYKIYFNLVSSVYHQPGFDQLQ